ncbi:hypothetical protein FCOIX_4728 [Fusarium coicis]|nr:hypothetical protein FCOIX_4728 [Fusarium coicis]
MNDFSPRLHVIYAGRGDAMYIEWTDKTQKKHLVLLDGGPLLYEAVPRKEDGVKRPGGNAAPYSKYLFAAGQRIWNTRFSDKDKFEPNVIINSHPHDDHLDGLLAFLRFAVLQRKKDFAFKGQFYQPYCENPRNLESGESRNLENTRKLLVKLFKWAEGTGFDYKGIQVDYPTAKSILKWDAKPSLGDPSYDPDKSPVNLESILMRTLPKEMQVEGTMYFTGDSVGWRIMKQKPPTKLSIYKVQHHGSMVNTQIQQKGNRIKFKVGYEATVRDWFRCLADSSPRYKWDLEGKGPSKIMEIIQEEFPEFGDEDTRKTYLNNLEIRHRTYVKMSIDDKVTSPMAEITKPELLPKPSAVYTAVLGAVSKIPDTDAVYGTFYGKKDKPTKWWQETKAYMAREKDYLRYMAVVHIKKFFSSFVADAYVISANHHNNHPAPETILGLALANKDQVDAKTRTTGGILYVTDGSAIDLPALQELATEMNVDWPTLMSSSLTIRVLKTRCFMSLNASDVVSSPNRDTDGATEEISLDAGKIAEGKAFRADIEADTSHLGIRDLGPVFCSIVTTGTTKELYLTIAADHPSLQAPTSTVIPPNIFVEYYWISQGTTSMRDEEEVYHLVVKQWVVEKWKKMDFWMDSVTAELGATTKTLLYWKEADKKKAFYINSSAAGDKIEIQDYKSPPPSGYGHVFFNIRLDSDNQPVLSPIPKLPHGPQSFRSFCDSSLLDPNTISSASKAIEALTSSEILNALDLFNDFENTVLNYEIDPDKSVVQYEYDEVSVQVQSANLVFKVPANASVQVGSGTYLVKDVTFDLSWDKQDLIEAKLDIKTMAKGIELVVKKEVPGIKHASTLKKVLIGMGVRSEQLLNVRLPKLLGYLINSDSKMYSLLFQETPASLLLSGILRLVPDLDRSRARVTMLPGNMPLIHQADIKCHLDTAVGVLQGGPKPEPFNPNITFAGVNLVIQTLGLSVYNATSPDETIVLTGTAKFAAAKKQGLTINLRCVIEGQGDAQPELEFTIEGTQSLRELVAELPATMRFTEAVPLNGKGFTLDSLGTSQVGFAVTQPVTAHSHCVLSRIWAATDFSEWQTFLPASFPKVRGDVKVQVYNPLDEQHISVGVEIHYKTRINTTPPCDIDVTFFANPLPKSDSYEYRLWLSPSNRSLTLYGILEAVGVTNTDTFKSALDALPMLKKGITILIHQVSFAVEKSTISGWKFGDWSLKLGVSNVMVLQDLLTVQRGTLDIGLLDGTYHCSMQADFFIEKIKTVASASFRLPQKDAVGSLNIDIPDGLSVSDMIDALGLPNTLHHLPLLVKSILEVQLLYAHFTIGYPVTASNRAAILGCELSLNWDEGLEVGIIGLNQVKVDITYTSSENPLGTGKSQYGFAIAAIFSKSAVMAQLSYSSTVNELNLSIDALETVLVTDILNTLLGDKITNALAPAIGTLTFRQGRLTIDTGPSNVVKYFKLELGETATVKVDNLTITSLLIEYTAAVTRLPEPKPASLLLLGQVRNGTAAAKISISCIAKGDEPAMVKASLEPISKEEPLTLTGLLTLFGFSRPTFIEPEGCPNFFSLNVVEMLATIEVREATETERGTLIVRALDAVAVSTGTLSIFDTVTLQNIGLGVHYTKDKKDETTSITAKVVGDLIIHGLQGPIRVAYIQTKEGREFHGIYIKQDAAPPLSFEKMAGQFVSPDKYAIPEHLGMPKIGLRQVEVHLVIKKSLQISGVGIMQWGYESNGVPISLAEIGGAITVKKTNQGSLLLPEGTEYDAFITGKLSMADFASATDIRARLRIGTSHAPVLTAVLQKTTNDNKELVRLSQNMSSSKQLAWDRVSPDGTADISFPSTDVYLYADLSRSKGKLFLCAHIDDLGDATIFARPDTNDPTRHSYFFSVSCTNLTKIWDKTKEPVMSTFKLSQIGAQIIGYHGTVGSLMDELVLLKKAASAEDIKIEDSSSILTTMNKETTLDPGGWFFATVQLQQPKPSPLVKALEDSMSANQGEAVTLFGKIDKYNQSRTQYGINVRNLYLLGGTMVVSGQGIYAPAVDTRAPNILVQGQMKVLELSTEPFTIDVDFGVTLEATRFSLRGTVPPGPLRKPFGAMFNVEIKFASIYGVIQHTGPKRAIYVLRGSGSIGSSSLKFSSLVVFDRDLKPTVVALVLDAEIPDPKLPALKQRDLTTDDVFTHIIQPNSETSPSWPRGYSGLVFKTATVYYASKDFLDSEKHLYEQGYHVKALVGFFGYDFTVSASIPLDQSGLKVAATYEGTVDLSFAKFDKATVSIITSKDENATVYGAKADLTLFMKSGFHIDLKYERGHDRYSATASYLGTDKILGLSNPTVTLTYDNKTGLMGINNWPTYQDLKDGLSTVEFAEGLKEASAKETTCEKIVELIFKETITTKYNMEFKGASVSDTHLLLNFSGTWDVKIVLEPPVTIVAIPLPDISVEVSKKLSLDQLGVAVVKMLVDNISSIALQLLKQPAKLAAFFGALVVKEYVQQTITALICRRVNERNVRDRADELIEENQRDVRSNSQRIDQEVARSSASSSLEVVGGSFAVAEGFLDGLITVCSLMGSLVEVYSAMDTDKADELKKKAAQAKQKKEEAEVKVAELKERLVKGLSLDPQVQIPARFKDDQTIVLDWSKVPLILQTDKTPLSWDIISSPEDDKNNPDAIKMSTESASRTFTTPPTKRFLSAPSVWTWVRAKATFGNTEVQGLWHPAQTLTHMPAMMPPNEVGLDGPPVVNGTHLTVSMPKLGPGDYRICIVTQDDLTASRPLYSTGVHIAATSDFAKQLRVLEVEACPPTTTAIRAVAKTLSSDPAKFNDSPYTSSQSLEILPPPLNLTASMAGLTVMVTWDLPGQSQDDCELVVLNATTVEPESTATIRFQPTKEGQRLASVQGPSFQEGYHVFLAARQKSTKVSAIGVYTTVPFLVSNIPLWTIDALESYYDISAKTLVLTITSASRAVGPLTFEVLLSGVTTLAPSSTQLSDQSAVLRINNLREPYPSTVQVRATNAAHVRGIFGAAWNFPSVPQDLPAPQPKISYTAGILTLAWPAIPVANVRVLVWVQDSKTMKVLCSKKTPPSATSLTFSSQDFLIVPGMKLIFTCNSRLDNIQGSATRVSYEIADMNKGWGTPHELIIPAPETKITYSAVTAYSVPQPMDSTLFWASSSAKKITKLDWNNGNWLASTIPGQSMDLLGFCSITNTSRHAGHKEFFYIREDGTIKGFLYFGSGGGWSPQTYAFATETANLNKGAVIDAVSPNSTTSLLCWVARDGALRYSVWGSSTRAWSVANYAAGPQSATITEAGFIRATSQDGKGVHVFYRGRDGDLRGVFCNLVSDGGSMRWNGFTIHTDPDTRPRGSALCVSGVGTPIRIFWSSVNGRVVEAHRDGESLDSWKVQSVTSPDSVGTSNMTVVYRDSATVCLWWITPGGAICRGDGNTSTDGKISDWTVTKQLPDGTALSTTASPWPPGVASNFYTTSHSSVMSIFWVSPDQVLMGQAWSREH